MRNNYDNIEFRETKDQKEFLTFNIMSYLECLGYSFSKQFVRLLGIVSQSVNAVLQRSNNNDGVKPMEWQWWKIS